MTTSTVPELPEPATSDLNAVVDSLLQAVDQQRPVQTYPGATYRLQFNGGFTFNDATRLIPYLSRLGVTHVYASPYLKAGPGSQHGYDIVDPSQLNGELGTADDFDRMVSTLRAHGMGHILDFVPNHMGVGNNDNLWWNDVLENGASSVYATYFDIDWMPLKPDLANKVLLPVLGDQFGKVLEDQQIRLHFEDGAFHVTYFSRRFPIGPRSSLLVLKHHLDELEKQVGSEDPHLIEYQSILTAIGHLPCSTETSEEKLHERRREKEVVKRRLNELARQSPTIREFITGNVQFFNGTKGVPHSFDLLDELLQDQPYRLAYWRVAADEINYRRFFDVNELAAISMEQPEVFRDTHRLVFWLLGEGKLDGLRIDHADGLYDPTGYLCQLQCTRFLQICRKLAVQHFPRYAQAAVATEAVLFQRTGAPEAVEIPALEEWQEIERRLLRCFEKRLRDESPQPREQPLFVLVEKILEPGERLPGTWPVQGTTGYDFMNAVNGIFIDSRQAKAFTGTYARFVHQQFDFRELVYSCKKLILETAMSSEVSVLAHQLDRMSETNRWSRDYTLNSLGDTIREIIACFPVYRTYITETGEVLDRDRRFIHRAVAQAKSRNPATSTSLYDFLRDMLLLEASERFDDEPRQKERLRFVGKFQQTTGPIMAKGVEDTAFYIYHRLVSLNDVGGDPEEFGRTVDAFHQQNRERAERWPFAMLATATHDNKRGEDVRARINVLSEIHRDWKARAFRWSRWNQRRKTRHEGELFPSRNDEYLLYQTLVGSWPLKPLTDDTRAEYIGRIQEYMLKAAHEAKLNTSWVSPNETYERALTDFIAAILTDSPRNTFLTDFVPFAEHVTQFGIWNSLSQTVLKLTSPGIPDIYQGTENWDLHLVDPDNRRPVDYHSRQQTLDSFLNEAPAEGDLSAFVSDLLACRADGRIKQYILWRLLQLRRTSQACGTQADYTALELSGNCAEFACAFARSFSEEQVVVVVPRLVVSLMAGITEPPVGGTVWQDTHLRLPGVAAETRYRNVFTGEILTTGQGDGLATLRLADLFRIFPVAVLVKER